MEPVCPAVEARSLNHWTARKSLKYKFIRLLEDRRKFGELGVDEFLDMTLKVCSIKEKIDNVDLMLKSFALQKTLLMGCKN